MSEIIQTEKPCIETENRGQNTCLASLFIETIKN